MTDYSTFISSGVNSSSASYNSNNNNTSNMNSSVNIFGIANNDLQAFTNGSQHHLNQFYNQNQNGYNPNANAETFSHHSQHNLHQVPIANSYKNMPYVAVGMSNSWKNFTMQNSISSASSSPHIESNTNTQNNTSLQSQSNNYNSG